jgi:nitrate/TMAO reductase-like tetraheme cytochrome c subunit
LDARSRTAREKIPSLCGRCHAGELEQYDRSIHGKALHEGKRTDAATCFDCHMEHLVPNVRQEEWQLSLIRQCGGCHKEEMDTYHKTFHGKVTRLGYATMAKCADCHGSHEILPPGERASTLSKENRVKTCGKCHPGASTRFTGFYAHAEETNKAKYPLLYYTYRFMTALLIGVFTFFFLHTFLWAYRSLKDLRKGREGKQ